MLKKVLCIVPVSQLTALKVIYGNGMSQFFTNFKNSKKIAFLANFKN